MNVQERIAELREEQRAIEGKYHNFRMGVSNTVKGLPTEYARFQEIDTEIQTLKSQRIAELTAELEALTGKSPKFISALTGTKKKQREILSEIRTIQQC
ncbi:MAG: hypothetical protein ACI4XD_03275 [Clostridia bacterium]